MSRWLVILLVVSSFWAWRDWSQRPIVHPPGAVVSEQPRQSNLTSADSFSVGDFQVTPRARFELRARVLSTQTYRWGAEAGLAPVDLALGWGAMSDQSVLDRIDITQGNRWYFWRYDFPVPLEDSAIIQNSGNMHIIPASTFVGDELDRLRRGDVVNLRGFLVDVASADGFRWTTSMTRADTGNGSCELFYVEFIQRDERP